MTLEDAIQKFLEAANSAIHESDVVLQAWQNLKDLGVVGGTLEFRADLTVREVAPSRDADFLRQLRITPDLEVRE